MIFTWVRNCLIILSLFLIAKCVVCTETATSTPTPRSSRRPVSTAASANPLVHIDCDTLGNGIYVWGCASIAAVCVNGQKLWELCPAGLVFNPQSNRCQAMRDTPVCSIPEPNLYRSIEPLNCWLAPDGLYAADGADGGGPCSPLYIKCRLGRRYDDQCPTGQVFTPSQRRCDYLASVSDECQPSHHRQSSSGGGRKFRGAGRFVSVVMSARVYRQWLAARNRDSNQ